MQNHILSIILFTPLLGAIVLLFVPNDNKAAIRWIAVSVLEGSSSSITAPQRSQIRK